jgi:putative sterol carrier protein
MSIEEKKKIADDIMNELAKKLNESKDLTEGWGKAIQIVFTDIETGYNVKFAMDGSIEKTEKKPLSAIKPEDAEATCYCTVDDLKDIIDGKVSAMEAMGSGKFRIEGKLDALMKLAPAMM